MYSTTMFLVSKQSRNIFDHHFWSPITKKRRFWALLTKTSLASFSVHVWQSLAEPCENQPNRFHGLARPVLKIRDWVDSNSVQTHFFCHGKLVDYVLEMLHTGIKPPLYIYWRIMDDWVIQQAIDPKHMYYPFSSYLAFSTPTIRRISRWDSMTF